jgi:ribosomal protein L11 methyltransferase
MMLLPTQIILKTSDSIFMKYFELNIQITPNSETASDILSALLAEAGFEAFEPTEDGLLAWIQQTLYDSVALEEVVSSFPLSEVSISYSLNEAPDENWNQQWEQEGFRPIIIEDKESNDARALLVIHDTSHPDVPEALYDICINPCQAFGTGSHQTTQMILSQLLAMPIKNRIIVDAGTGTGILSIMCMMLGASEVLAYDIDEWSVRNAQSNLLLNGIETGVNVLLGDSSVLTSFQHVSQSTTSQKHPSLLIANINRNILLADMQVFAQTLAEGGELLLSGFFTEDAPILLAEASKYGLEPHLQREEDNWCLLLLKKGKSY